MPKIITKVDTSIRRSTHPSGSRDKAVSSWHDHRFARRKHRHDADVAHHVTLQQTTQPTKDSAGKLKALHYICGAGGRPTIRKSSIDQSPPNGRLLLFSHCAVRGCSREDGDRELKERCPGFRRSCRDASRFVRARREFVVAPRRGGR